MRNITYASLLLLMLFAAGCAGWAPSGGLYEDRSKHYSVNLPEGWFMSNSSDLFLTKNGPELQYIFVQTQPLGKPLIFSKKTLYPGMKSIDMAEYFLENNALDQRMTGFKVKDLSTGQILGYTGFRLEGTYENSDGLTHGFIYYGFMTDDLYYAVSYSAPERVYFKQHTADFNLFFSSFRIIQE
jgi:hypothetical protein